MDSFIRRQSLFGLALALVGALAGPQAYAGEVADFYRGRQVTLVVGFAGGSGYDLYGRLFARHLSRHIPGNPDVVLQHMPGAASMRLAATWPSPEVPPVITMVVIPATLPAMAVVSHSI